MVVLLIGNALVVINKGFCEQLFLTLESVLFQEKVQCVRRCTGY
jgi:hypothetical protein